MFFNFKKKKAEKQAAAAKQAEQQKKLEEAKQAEASKATKKNPTPAKTKSTAPAKETKKTEPKAEAKPAKTTAKTTAKANTAKAAATTKTKAKQDAPTKDDPQPGNGPKGKFSYYRTAKGYYNYRLKASNNETIAVSGGTGYAALSGCKAGIESVRKNINAPIEDQTLKNYLTLPNPKFVLFKDKAGKFRYRLFARNGELICTPEDGYSSKDACKKGIASLAKWATNSDIVAED